MHESTKLHYEQHNVIKVECHHILLHFFECNVFEKAVRTKKDVLRRFGSIVDMLLDAVFRSHPTACASLREAACRQDG